MSAVHIVHYTGSPTISIPPQMGVPRADQLQGTVQEQLVEICGRVCYDSLGTGRNSADFHKHLVEVKHYSVHEHVHFTILRLGDIQDYLGITDTHYNNGSVTFNLRHILERKGPFGHSYYQYFSGSMCPQIIKVQQDNQARPNEIMTLAKEECFVSVFLEESRVWSHEMVRHRANMSQRSGRFCDETDRPMCTHPELLRMMDEVPNTDLTSQIAIHDASSRELYLTITDKLQSFLQTKGADKLTARKQARSAARYYLGNGLSTEMIFTASIAHWNHIFKQRCGLAADAAIRELMIETREKMRAETPFAGMIEPD